jgi:glutamate synthase (ferredoxin)
VFGDAVADLLPIIEPGGSDSAALDNAFELLTLAGRDPLHALAMLVPEAFEGDDAMDPDLRGFYEYHATLMEPWDGPAALAVSDGRYAIAALDRNGLRPQRYLITDDGLVVVGSEAGMVPLADRRVVERGRLGPGTMLAVDVERGELLRNADVKRRLARQAPYRAWVDRHLVPRRPRATRRAARTGRGPWRGWRGAAGAGAPRSSSATRPRTSTASSARWRPAATCRWVDGRRHAAGAALEQPQALYRYAKQRFAQVTNPPIDPLRERRVMSLHTVLGPRGPLLDETPTSSAVMRFDSPVIDEGSTPGCSARRVPAHRAVGPLAVEDGPEGMEPRSRPCATTRSRRWSAGHGVLVLSDRGADAEHAPIPMLLAVSAVHQRLLRVGRRTRTALVADTGEAREDHHVACLIGFGAALVHPYLALASARDLAAPGPGGAALPLRPSRRRRYLTRSTRGC